MLVRWPLFGEAKRKMADAVSPRAETIIIIDPMNGMKFSFARKGKYKLHFKK